jgi:O-Antigen ligase
VSDRKHSHLSHSVLPVLLLVIVAGILFLLSRGLPLTVWLGSAALVGAAAWCLFVARYPLAGFLTVFFVLLVCYQRLAIPLGSGAAGGGGTAALGDLLWLGCLFTFLLISFPRGVPRPAEGQLSIYYWLMVPYVLAAFLLPVLGVIVFRYPPSYALSGIRQLQWASLAPMVSFLCGRYGVRRVSELVIKTLLAGGILHVLYGLVQFAFGTGLVGPAWIVLDQLYNIQMGTNRYFYPRATGLLINPNALGVYAALLFGMVLGFRPQGFVLISKRLLIIIAVVSIFGLFLSGSRSGMLGVLFLLLLLVLLAGFSARVAAGGATGILLLGVVLLVSIPLLADYLPNMLVHRFGRLIEIFQKGAEVDPTANARVLEWGRLWEMYLKDYPMGTWVPPSYALGSPIDSYYVLTAIQGTPLFTLAWLLFMGGAAAQGLAVFGKTALGDLRGVGLLLFLTVGVALGSGLGMSIMALTPMIGALWVLVGLNYHLLHMQD